MRQRRPLVKREVPQAQCEHKVLAHMARWPRASIAVLAQAFAVPVASTQSAKKLHFFWSFCEKRAFFEEKCQNSVE